jgi:hypothetical protein
MRRDLGPAGIALFVMLAGCTPADPPIDNGGAVPGGQGAINLEQGWNPAMQQRAWFGSFGSRLIPTDWLLALRSPDDSQAFMADRHMDSLGFLVQSPTPGNPQGFPVGFTQHDDADGARWTGLGCAACHTGEVRFKDQRIRLDGGQGTLDFNAFEAAMIASLRATLASDERWARFAAVLEADGGPRLGLREDIRELADRLDARHRMNQVEVAYGPGRLDAFGQIFNAVAVQFLDLPENARTPDAPVSIPVLWDAPHLDLVQWNGSAPNAGPGPLLQNITTALAVYGSLDITRRAGIDGYTSSIDFSHLDQIENDLYALQAPQWPQALLGALDGERVSRGAQVYAQHCQSCHALSDRNDAKRKLKATITPLEEVGTDPRMAQNFLASESASGAFEGRKQGVVFGPALGARAQTSDLVVHAAVGAALGHPLQSVRDAVGSLHSVIKTPLDPRPRGYKARPLSGIWASAPYLHNGSVPNLAELLTPPGKRSTQFPVGSRAFDPERVGLDLSAPGSMFDTGLPGNSNVGHVYGTTLAESEKRDLLEYLKSL